MLPALFVTLATFLLEVTNSSPVYNMQPAFITANIGTTGRNIRNLPCISRKNSQSGVCMFAIDCLKSNGTHLGTCIDRFYFGSCCHIEPVHDIIENTIDTDLIPSREPPHRISSTTTSQSPLSSTEMITTSSVLNKIANESSTTVLTSIGTSTSKITSSLPKTTLPTTSSTTSRTTTSTTTTSTTTTTTTTTSPPIETTTEAQKLQTFQSVDGTLARETTIRPTTSSTTSRPTKPTTKPTRAPSKATSKPKPARPTNSTSKPIKTTKPTSKPTKVPTRTTPKTSSKPTPKPTKSSTTTRRTSPTRRTTTTPKPTKKIVTISSSTQASTTTTTSTTPKPPVLTTKPIIRLNLTTTTSTTTTTTEVPKSPSTETSSSTTSSTTTSTSTSTTTQAPALVTWTFDDSKTNGTNETEATTHEAWVPITTSDSWVLLPNVPPTTTAQPNMTKINSSTTESLINMTTSKPSTNYIPLVPEISTSSASVDSTTAPTLNLTTNSTTTTSNTNDTISTTSSNNDTLTSTTESPLDMRPVNMTDFTDVCGRRMSPEARIVGGEKSSFGKWPWQISLRQWRTSTYLHKCGAALLNENWAITAAHCVDNVPPSDLLLRLGEHDLSTESEPYLHQERRVQIVASHPQFDPRTFEYDLALLRFYEPVTFQPNILPVCVPQNDENFVGRTAYVTGWGRLYEDGPLPSVLQEVSVPVINNTVCESMYRSAGYIEHIPHIFICAGWRRGGFDSCEGDSGGPMVIQREDKRFLLAGVISWGIGCAEPNQPGVYTRISEFRDWINQILQF